MKLFEKADANAEAIRNSGRWAIARAKASGVAVHYIDSSVGPGVIEELPDGTRYGLITEPHGATAPARP